MSDDQHKVIGDAPAPETALEKEQTQAAEEFSGQKTPDGELSMSVKVHSPFKDYYDGPAFSISAVNDTGAFDILPKHHNFITLLTACDIMVRTVGKGDQKIRISGGIMHVKADKVIVFLDV